ncbi:MAG: winged helix-turn-helix domain-containing tetratricopeptide repeat protein, partial [Blastocatellia bacterium]
MVERSRHLVAREEIIKRIWGPDIFVDTSNSINTAIRKIRHALKDDPDAPRFIETVPTKGYRFIASTFKVVANDSSDPRSASEGRRPMLVVLPFENLGNNPAQEYFSDGLTEETIANLGQIASDRLGVIARTSAMTYKGTRKSIAEIGRELNVDFALEGSVRRDGSRVRITAQLVRTCDQTHFWTQQYDRDLKDFLGLQGELGRAIAEQVEVKLSLGNTMPNSQTATVNQEAYDLYLRGRFHLSKVTRPNLELAIGCFREATKIDPKMAVAFAGIGDAYDILPITSDAAPHDAFPIAEQAAREALKLDGGLAEAHCVLASLHFWYNWDWIASEEHCRQALARNPSYARAHLNYGHLLSNTGRHDEAIVEIELARQLDPFSLIINTHCAQFRYHAGRYNEVIPILAKTFELDPNFWVAHIVLAKAYQQQGRQDLAVAAAEKARQFSSGNTEALSLMGYSYGANGARDEAGRILGELQQLAAQRYVPPYNFAVVYLGLGEYRQALD